jgi:hypothetical protein
MISGGQRILQTESQAHRLRWQMPIRCFLVARMDLILSPRTRHLLAPRLLDFLLAAFGRVYRRCVCR